jgi:hypothetical protein
MRITSNRVQLESVKGQGMLKKLIINRGFMAALFSVLSTAGLCGCTNLNDPYGYGGGYSPPPPSPYYGGAPYYGGGSGYYGNDPYRRERRDLERERERLEEERRRLEREKNKQPIPPAYTRPAPPADRCPPGFSPSERKCTPEERRRGCRDMRMPSGLGCVDRR